MLRSLENLNGVKILNRDAQKTITGGGGCGVKVDGVWYPMPDLDGDGGTRDDAEGSLGKTAVFNDGSTGTITNWCCDSCSWNQ